MEVSIRRVSESRSAAAVSSVEKMTLPELMYVRTSAIPAASNAALSARISTVRAPPTLTPRSSATYLMGRVYESPRRLAEVAQFRPDLAPGLRPAPANPDSGVLLF